MLVRGKTNIQEREGGNESLLEAGKLSPSTNEMSVRFRTCSAASSAFSD